MSKPLGHCARLVRRALSAGLVAGVAAAASAHAADMFPHQAQASNVPYPDYFTEALKLTSFRAGERFSALKLAPGIEPELLVLPVQSQAFGWAPAFNAIVGAQLDRELGNRRARANRQTDLFDADGPFVRRFDTGPIGKFAAGRPNAGVLALYLGHDGARNVFVTMTLDRNGRVARSHRVLADADNPSAVIATVAGALPAMLTELGLDAKSAAARPAPASCRATDWDLPDMKLDASPSARACHAIIVGVLAPEFAPAAPRYPRLRPPAKLAWLAQAYVEADALREPAASALRTIAWSQMELAEGPAWPASIVDVDDPVVRPIARLLWSRERSSTMPTRTPDADAEAYAESAAAALPAFAKAVFIERARYDTDLRPVDLCAIEWELPSIRLPRPCIAGKPAGARPSSIAAAGRAALVDEWQLAAAFKDIRIQGALRGDARARKAIIDDLSPRVAGHPFLRRAIFATNRLDLATGDVGHLMGPARAATKDFVQATADTQRWDSLLGSYAVRLGQWTTAAALTSDPVIAEVTNQEDRLLTALEFDGFARRPWPTGINPAAPRGMAERKAGADAANFLRPGLQWAQAAPLPPAMPPPIPVDLSAVFGMPTSMMTLQMVEKLIEREPMDMLLRTKAAMMRMKQGGSVADARAVIDARIADGRTSERIAESHAWALPAHALFFAGEFDAARDYYRKVKAIGTGSESVLHASVRLHLMEGDLAQAATATRERLNRYESDFARRDLAGLDFMRGENARAWATLSPRLAQSDEAELWAVVDSGRRIEHKTMRATMEQAMKSGWGNARRDDVAVLDLYLGRFIAEDHIPNDEELELLAEARKRSRPQKVAVLQARAKLTQLAFDVKPDPGRVQLARNFAAEAANLHQVNYLRPLYAWVVWQSGGSADRAVTAMKSATLQSTFDSLLAKAVILGLENNPNEALQYLRAARIELSALGAGGLDGDYRSAPYAFGLSSYLLYSKTHEAGYRDEALRVARAYQRIFPFLAWPYALEASLAEDGPARTTAACRAHFLDRDSQFLKLSGFKAGVWASCPQTLW